MTTIPGTDPTRFTREISVIKNSTCKVNLLVLFAIYNRPVLLLLMFALQAGGKLLLVIIFLVAFGNNHCHVLVSGRCTFCF